MQSYARHIGFLLTVCSVLLGVTSCYDTEDYRVECDYNIQIVYLYNAENGSNDNKLNDYITHIEEFIFDGNGVLYAKNDVVLEECNPVYVSEQTYAPGRYSVIAIANRNSYSEYSEAVEGVTRRDDMTLRLANTNRAEGAFGNSERLYYGYRTFTIEDEGISRIHVDMINSHMVLNYKIIWSVGTPPANLTDFNVRMENMPSEYGLMPQYYYPEVQGICDLHNPDESDGYNKICRSVIHHIPTVQNNPDCNKVNHRYNVIKTGSTLVGQSITYRIRNTGSTTGCPSEEFTKTTFAVYAGDKRISNPIPLNDFFTALGENLDQTLRQEYALILEIHPNGQITVSFDLVQDWDDGGWLG